MTYNETKPYASCYARYDNSTQHLIIYFNEHPSRVEEKNSMGHDGFDMHMSKVSTVVLAVDGASMKSFFLDNAETNITFRPEFSAQINRKSLFMLYKGLEYKLAQLR